MLTAMRDERLHSDRELKKQSENEKSNSFLPSLQDKNGKIDVMRFRPSAQALITMAPAEKEDLFLKLKFIQKKAAQQNLQDPNEITRRVAAGDLNPCEAHSKIQNLEEARLDSSRTAVPELSAVQSAADQKRKAKSVERTAIKAAFSGMTQLENQHFEDLFKQTMKQISEVNGQFMTGKLMEKIKEKGSLYGMKASNNEDHDQEEKPG